MGISEPTSTSEAEHRHLAARAAASAATDPADLAMLLDMLGLDASEGLAPATVRTRIIRPRETVPERAAARALGSTLLAAVRH